MCVPDARLLPSAPPDRFGPMSSTVSGSTPIKCTRRLSDIRDCRSAAAAAAAAVSAATVAASAASAAPPAPAAAATTTTTTAAACTSSLDGVHTRNRLGC